MRRTQDQKRFTISEVAADWRERQWRSQDLVVVGALEEWGMGIGAVSYTHLTLPTILRV